MRIVSLLPAATEWLCAFGGEGDLVGRSHACTYPPSIQTLPVVTESSLANVDDAAAIDRDVRSRLERGLSLYGVDLPRIKDLQPDVIVTQAQCEVCAVSLSQLEELLGSWTGHRPRIHSMQPRTLKQVFDAALALATVVGRLDAAMPVIADGERKLRFLQVELNHRTTPSGGSIPRVACIEWLEPLMLAGHWMPDVVEMAGGVAVGVEKGEPSRTISWEELVASDPDVVAVLPCGYTLDETMRDLQYLTGRPGWEKLQAVRHDRVFLFDGDAYFNRPGPRLYRGVELLASALHPERVFPDPPPDPWEMTALC